MFGFDSIKWVAILVIVALFIFGLFYVTNLKANLAIAEKNTDILKESVNKQQEVMSTMKFELSQIRDINSNLTQTVKQQEQAIKDLDNKFTVSANGTSRDFGKITLAKPGLIENIINKATINVNRCFEIITGAKLNDKETNNECQEYINSL